MKIVSELAEVCLSVWKFYQLQPRSPLIFTQSAGRKEETDLIKWISPIAWRNVNLLGRFEFHRQQSIINIDEMISLLVQKIVMHQPKVTEELLA
jgi:hypothetical protein